MVKLRFGNKKQVEHVTLQTDASHDIDTELRFGKDLQPINHVSVHLTK